MSGDFVLVVAAHSDDEVLGCGGALRRHVESGHRVAAVHLTDGVGSRRSGAREEVERRRKASERAAAVIGYEWVARGDFPDNALDSVPLLEVVQFVEDVVAEVEPQIVYTHHGGDLNVDHQVAFRAALTALRPQPGAPRPEIRSFEVPSSTEWGHRSLTSDFSPNLFVDITAHWDTKIEALECYREELRPPPHPRSVESIDALARTRGAAAGLERAEAFDIIRRVETGSSEQPGRGARS